MLSRRDLLKTGGALIVGFTFDAALPRWTWAQTPSTGGDAHLLAALKPEISADGLRITAKSSDIILL
jgi:hypothetical protein